MEPDLLAVRATVHLQRFPVGSVARVDPSDPSVADLLEAGILVPHPTPVQESRGAVDTRTLDDAHAG